MKKVKIFEDPRYFSRDNKDCIRVCIKPGYNQLSLKKKRLFRITDTEDKIQCTVIYIQMYSTKILSVHPV